MQVAYRPENEPAILVLWLENYELLPADDGCPRQNWSGDRNAAVKKSRNGLSNVAGKRKEDNFDVRPLILPASKPDTHDYILWLLVPRIFFFFSILNRRSTFNARTHVNVFTKHSAFRARTFASIHRADTIWYARIGNHGLTITRYLKSQNRSSASNSLGVSLARVSSAEYRMVARRPELWPASAQDHFPTGSFFPHWRELWYLTLSPLLTYPSLPRRK